MPRRFEPDWIPAAPDFSFEEPLWRAGVLYVAGIDEAGRGSLAGPVVVGAIIIPPDLSLLKTLEGVRDSKELTPDERETWSRELCVVAVAWGVGFASHQEIDELGIIPATRLAALRALESLTTPPQHLLLDYIFLSESSVPQTALVKGDARSLSIASASILAKTTRDTLLCELDVQYPGYGFAAHKGYCTPGHLAALARLGPSPVHRLSYAPVRNLYELEPISFHKKVDYRGRDKKRQS